MNRTQIALTGNITRDPQLRYSANGTPVTTISIATNRSRKNDQGEWEDELEGYWNATAFNKQAERIATHYAKGDRIVIIGTLRQQNYTTKNGEERTSNEIEIDEIGMSVWDRKYATDSPNPAPTTSQPTDDLPF